MPSDSNLDKIPPSPIDDDDLWLINREDKSYKVTSKMLGSYLIASPVPEICDGDADCPPDRLCVDGFCERIPCDSEKPPGQEGCPPDYVCIGDYCYPKCDPSLPSPCGEGYICVDPGITGGDSICLPYPFPCRPDILPDDGCPPGYACWGGNCWAQCNPSTPDPCPPGMDCVETPSAGTGYICVPSGGGFPCSDGVCPLGYECFFGMCFKECNIDGSGEPCEEGFTCVTTDNGDYCVPYPFPCDLYGTGCPEGMICYNGECFPTCTPGGTPCEDGFSCIDIGGGNHICYPDVPQEGFVNDGPLVIRTEPLDFPNTPATEKIIFTANQYGRSVLTFQGFDQSPGGPGGGICSNTSDCPPGYTCFNGTCVLLPCDANNPCPQHPDWIVVCYEGFCFPRCKEDDLCPKGYECVDGHCLPGGVHPGGDGCSTNNDCYNSGWVCVNGNCHLKPCNNGTCPDGYHCHNGYCYKICGHDEGCPENHSCVEINPNLSICVPIGGGPDGGGSGGDININIDPDWWDPDKNPNSPIGNGDLVFSGVRSYNGSGTPTNTSNTVLKANQKYKTEVKFGPNIYVKPGNPNVPDKNGTLEIKIRDGFPVGTRLVFHNNSLPVGWERDTSLNTNQGMRVAGSAGLGAQSGRINWTDTFKDHNVPLKQHNHSVSSTLSGSINSGGAHYHEFTISRSGMLRTPPATYFTYEVDEQLNWWMDYIPGYNDQEGLVSPSDSEKIIESIVNFNWESQLFADWLDATDAYNNEEIDEATCIQLITDAIAAYDTIDKRTMPQFTFGSCIDVECPPNSMCYYGLCVAKPGYTYDSSTSSYVLDTDSIIEPDQNGDCDYCPENTTCVNGICECVAGYFALDGQCVPDGTDPLLIRSSNGTIGATDIVPADGNIVPGTGDCLYYRARGSCADGGDDSVTSCKSNQYQNYVSGQVGPIESTGTYYSITCQDAWCSVGKCDFSGCGDWIVDCYKPSGGGGGGPTDPCDGVNCSGGQICVNGNCECPVGQELVNGKCQKKVYKSSTDGLHTHTHNFSVSTSTNNAGVVDPKINLKLRYIDVIIAEKKF